MPVVPFIPAIIGAGAGLGGAAIAASGSKDAAKTQADATNRALDIAQQQYQQQRADLTPYRAAGSGALGSLAYGLGVPGFENGPTSQAAPSTPVSAPKPPAAPGAAPPPANLATLPGGQTIHTAFPDLAREINAANPAMAAGQQAGQQMGGGMVTVKSPNGQVGQIPANRLNDALAAGGQQVVS